MKYMVEKRLTQEEAKELYDMLGELRAEMNEQFEQSDDFDPDDNVSFTTLTRSKYRKFLEEKYNIN